MDKSVLERLPIRYNTNDFYFDDPFQGMPIGGYTKMFQKMLSNKNISIKLNAPYKKELENLTKKTIWTGKIDKYFSYKLGWLEYRCVKFTFEKFRLKDFLPNAVINFPEDKFKFLRITEFKKFYEKKSRKTIICKDFFSWGGEPCYPIINKRNMQLLKEYEKMAKREKKVYFLGRLGKFKYINMDQCVEDALELFKKIKKEDN